MIKFLVLPLSLLFSLYVASCVKAPKHTQGEPPAQAGTPAAQSATTSAQAQPAQSGGQPSVKSPKTITLTREQPRPVAVPALTNAGVSSLLAAEPEKRVLPEDFKIGLLGDPSEEAAEEGKAIGAAVSFLSSLTAGTVDRNLIAPETDKNITEFIGFSLEEGYAPKSFRIGRPKKNENGEVAANVRLFGAEGTSEGEIYLKRESRQWLVSDLQISMAQLAVRREKPSERFFPSAYRWLLGE